MESNRFVILSIAIATNMAIDLYTFKGISLLLKSLTSITLRKFLKWAYWIWSIGILVILAFVFTQMDDVFNYVQKSKSYFIPFSVIAILLVNILPKLWFVIFHLMEDVSWLGVRGIRKVAANGGNSLETMDRFTFLSKLGLLVTGVQFGWLLYGVTKGRFAFKMIEKTVSFPNLPKAFDGLRVVQLSDLHIGSFYNNYDRVK